MNCPFCGAVESRVLDSRPSDGGASIKRRRECVACNKRFNTYEVVDSVPLVVIKKDGSREFFDKHKLQSGLIKACQKRPVNIDQLVNDVEAELINSLATEITTREIGEMVMDRLARLDGVSYVRFASVYREFRDVESFLTEMNKLLRREVPPKGENA